MPPGPEADALRARILLRLGRAAEAAEIVDKLLREDSGAETFALAATVAEQMDERQAALWWLIRAVAAGYDAPQALEALTRLRDACRLSDASAQQLVELAIAYLPDQEERTAAAQRLRRLLVEDSPRRHPPSGNRSAYSNGS